MAPSPLHLLLLPWFMHFLILLPSAVVAQSSGTVGVTYTTAPSTADHVARFVESSKISAVRLPDANPTVIRSFTFTNVSLLLTIPNSLVPVIAANRSNAATWLYNHVVPYYPRARISTISVGNNVLDASPDLYDFVLPAINNIHTSLREIGIRSISVSTTFSFLSVMTDTFPPSSARFQSPADDVLIRPLLQFLEQTNSSFLINLYPYNVLRLNSEIPIAFALFQNLPYNFRDDITTGVRYLNLFDMMVDAVISAMAVAGHQSVSIIVTETGWPSAGSTGELEATQGYAEMYVKGLVKHLKSGVGTPLRKEGVAEAYIYELFDRDDEQEVNGTSRKWGIFYPNLTKKYDIQLSSSGVLSGNGSRTWVHIAGWIVLVLSSLLLH
uniref:Glucan endo-1,3-beta-D-glucosidase n=1 Tax=Kalanchoe fedtschenkoi TaxID=63787 RepID=A0A7N0UA28_KALFE